jgi:hypothetical protein
VETIPPATNLTLVGWVLMAEWQESDGQTLLTRLVGEDGSAWQAKGYLYEGLNAKWPESASSASHHNPGYPSGWTRVDD